MNNSEIDVELKFFLLDRADSLPHARGSFFKHFSVWFHLSRIADMNYCAYVCSTWDAQLTKVYSHPFRREERTACELYHF